MHGDMIGRVIKGRYKLIDERGRGNFATVYIARDLENNRIFAIKVMHQELSNDDDLIARFQREADILFNLNDPHIISIVEYVEEFDMHYIVMDYVDGQNLKYYIINDQPMEALRAFYYTHQIVEGLDTAYRKGVVHRDIKPQNILVTTNDVVKIGDFGLARGKDTVTLTQTNVFMGTAYYISPEQAESGRSADTRSDLYSVATVLFEMLTGHPPFEGDSAVDIVIKHMNDKVPSITRIRRDLPAEMDIFMQKALAKQAKDRFATPQEFLTALEQLQTHLPTEAPRVTPPLPYPEARGGFSGAMRPVTPVQKEARLLVLSSGQSIPLTGEHMIVGRQDPTMGNFPEINLMDKTVGRRHAYLHNQHGTFTVEDLNAMNKTRLNGVILPPHEERILKDGDILRFGTVEVRFELR